MGGAAQRGVGRDDDTGGDADAAQLLYGHTVHDIGAASPAILGGNRDTHKAYLGHFLHCFHGETLLFVDLGGEGFHLFLRKLANHLKEELFFFRKAKIHIVIYLVNSGG